MLGSTGCSATIELMVGLLPGNPTRRAVVQWPRSFPLQMFSKLETKIQARVQKLLDRIEGHRVAGKVINISNAYRCYATDVIPDYAAPHTRDFLNSPDFAAAFNGALKDLSKLMLWHRHLPFLFPVMNAIPKSVSHCAKWIPQVQILPCLTIVKYIVFYLCLVSSLAKPR